MLYLRLQGLLYDWQQMIKDVMLRVGTATPPSEADSSETETIKTRMPYTNLQ